jgi:hypothetical protein
MGIFVRKRTTAAIIEALRTQNVLLFLYRESRATGVFHALASARVPCVLVRITSKTAQSCSTHTASETLRKTTLQHYRIEYLPYRYENPSTAEPHAFMARLRTELYGRR